MNPGVYYNDGFQRQIASLIFGGSSIKSAWALDGLMKGVKAVHPAQLDELASLGEQIFHKSLQTPSLAPVYVGYGKLQVAHNLRKAIDDFANKGDTARASETAQALHNHFIEMGRTAKPRINMLHTKLPIAGGVAAGGWGGYELGHHMGGKDENENIRSSLSQAPLMDRLNYLFNPGALNG